MTKKEILRSRICPAKPVFVPINILELHGREVLHNLRRLVDLAAVQLSEMQKHNAHVGVKNGW